MTEHSEPYDIGCSCPTCSAYAYEAQRAEWERYEAEKQAEDDYSQMHAEEELRLARNQGPALDEGESIV